MGRATMRTVVLAIFGATCFTGVAGATIGLRDEAVKAGHPAQDCSYCHSFSSDHMKERAQAMGVSSLNCLVCHGNKLPKSGTALFNDRGRWLLAERFRRKAPRVDVVWLKQYRPPSPAP